MAVKPFKLPLHTDGREVRDAEFALVAECQFVGDAERLASSVNAHEALVDLAEAVLRRGPARLRERAQKVLDEVGQKLPAGWSVEHERGRWYVTSPDQKMSFACLRRADAVGMARRYQ